MTACLAMPVTAPNIKKRGDDRNILRHDARDPRFGSALRMQPVVRSTAISRRPDRYPFNGCRDVVSHRVLTLPLGIGYLQSPPTIVGTSFPELSSRQENPVPAFSQREMVQLLANHHACRRHYALAMDSIKFNNFRFIYVFIKRVFYINCAV